MNECVKHPIEICPLARATGSNQAGKTPLWVLNMEMGGLDWAPLVAFLECFWICSPSSHQP